MLLKSCSLELERKLGGKFHLQRKYKLETDSKQVPRGSASFQGKSTKQISFPSPPSSLPPPFPRKLLREFPGSRRSLGVLGALGLGADFVAELFDYLGPKFSGGLLSNLGQEMPSFPDACASIRVFFIFGRVRIDSFLRSAFFVLFPFSFFFPKEGCGLMWVWLFLRVPVFGVV